MDSLHSFLSIRYGESEIQYKGKVFKRQNEKMTMLQQSSSALYEVSSNLALHFSHFLKLIIYLGLRWVSVVVWGLLIAVTSLVAEQSLELVALGLSCSTACGILLHQGSNLCLLHWQVDSHPLYHQGSPSLIFFV